MIHVVMSGKLIGKSVFISLIVHPTGEFLPKGLWVCSPSVYLIVSVRQICDPHSVDTP